MLKSLRWKLTLLYLFAALGLVSLMGFGTYLLIDHYFQQTTDLVLGYKMATEFRLLNLKLPSELQASEELWLQNNRKEVTVVRPSTTYSDDHEEDDHDESSESSHVEESYLYNADLAAVFVISLDADGNPITVPNIPSPPAVDSPEALLNAQGNGYDIRTIDVQGRGRIRLLTYRTNAVVPTYLQTGRLLTDQDRTLEQYLLYLAILGGVTSVLLALVSWLLAGRSLEPVQKAWDQQQTFVSNASHELRTPLTFIRATADYSLRSQPNQAQAPYLTDILNECDYMDHLVDDLLLLSRLDAHRLKLDLELLSLPELFSETKRHISKIAEEEQVTVQISGYSGHIYADRVRIRQVLLILLDNALRFTPAGGTIRLNAERREKHIIIEVADTGKGIAPEHLPHIFDRFYQVGTSENESSRSNGLGLSIARTLVEAHHGSISIKSQVGQGTQIRISLPAVEEKHSI